MKGPFDVWRMYVRLKLHFSGQMSYFSYSDVMGRLTLDAYRRRQDRHFFERVWEEFGSDSKRFLMSSFVALKRSPNELMIHDMLEDSHYEDQWKRFQKAEMSLSGSFRRDLQLLIRRDKQKSLKHTIRPEGGLPLLLRRCHSFDFGIESYVILNKVVPVNKMYMNEYSLDPRTSRLCNVAAAYDDFVQVDSGLVKNIIKEVSEIEGD